MNKLEFKSYLFVALTILLWCSSAAVGKILLGGLGVIQLMFLTSFAATVFLFFLVLWQGKLTILRSYGINDYKKIFFTGIFGFFLYIFCFYSALKLLSAQQAYIINYLWPIMVVLAAVFILKEKIKWQGFLAILISFAGVLVSASQGNLSNLSGGNLWGGLLALAGAVFYGIFSALDKKFGYDKNINSFLYYFFNLIIVSVLLFSFSSLPKINLNQLLGVIWAGPFVGGLASIFWLSALKYGETAKVSNLILLTPFVSLVYIRILLGEAISIYSIVGLLILVAGVLWQSSLKKNV